MEDPVTNRNSRNKCIPLSEPPVNMNTSNDEQCKVVLSNDNDSIAIPRENVNIPDSSSRGIDLELNEDVEPIVTSDNQDLETVDKINTPKVRHSSRCNKRVNKMLEQDYEFRNVKYCQLCKLSHFV